MLTADTITALPAAVLSMPTGEWVVALYASDMPTKRGSHAPEQVAAWIEQGTERLGGELEVWRRARDARRAAQRRHIEDVYAGERQLFPKPRRYQRAIDEAHGLAFALEQAGVIRTFPSTTVWLCNDQLGETFTVKVPARDVEKGDEFATVLLDRVREGKLL